MNMKSPYFLLCCILFFVHGCQAQDERKMQVNPTLNPGTELPQGGRAEISIDLPPEMDSDSSRPRWLEAYDNPDYDPNRCLTCDIWDYLTGGDDEATSEDRGNGGGDAFPSNNEDDGRIWYKGRLVKNEARAGEIERDFDETQRNAPRTAVEGRDYLAGRELKRLVKFEKDYRNGKLLLDPSHLPGGVKSAANQGVDSHNQNVKLILGKIDEQQPQYQAAEDGFRTSPDTVAGQSVRNTSYYIQAASKSIEESQLPDVKYRKGMLGLATRLLGIADTSYAEGQVGSGDEMLSLSVDVVDLALSSIPVVSWGKDIYEAVTGESLVDGRKLDKWERASAIAGSVSLGVLSKVGKVSTVLRIADKVGGNVDGASKVISSANRLGIDEAGDIQRVLEARGKHKRIANEPDFQAPPKSVDSYGRLKNDSYTIEVPEQKKHVVGSLDATNHTGREQPPNKSQFLYSNDADDITLDAASYADRANLWKGEKAKVTFDRPIGVHARTGRVTNSINVYKKEPNSRGVVLIHGSPASPE